MIRPSEDELKVIENVEGSICSYFGINLGISIFSKLNPHLCPPIPGTQSGICILILFIAPITKLAIYSTADTTKFTNFVTLLHIASTEFSIAGPML